ncbi:hypothetical protein TRFO_24490 [Tritrichomonas foetus]|uniref:Uncharacterized protein n=1 Tax=Tritrichomonas foetus TaxID=1144522 RepID=A0A1J4K8R7_9EUKA|nr:hypothetical protein TRFO_24490 [Tritrichomonas foetus]|eukprot:OHT07330.1 hypothetical protein TRFO_24490 [Tritrichomonas foetus]
MAEDNGINDFTTLPTIKMSYSQIDILSEQSLNEMAIETYKRLLNHNLSEYEIKNFIAYDDADKFRKNAKH